uniref:Uncharacterized protein n=1 Tax=Paramoeba aestuarina TaxID=180227 RepID=A0A7S4JST7_9EUKA|mmetsp:Transcript_12735/g.19551  ORF Transcript_12735/g.19551 Transcript_12735/m.19551 type:complete len:359 (+) Transcript_12735:137-1213(+)
MSFLLDSVLSYLADGLGPSAATFYEQNQLAHDSVDLTAGSSLVETRRMILKKINTNHRRLGKKNIAIFEKWPEVSEQVEKDRNAIINFSRDLKVLPSLLETLGGITARIKRVSERTAALEELLTGLEVYNAQMKHERWKRKENMLLNQFQGSLGKDLALKKHRYENTKSKAQQEYMTKRFQCKEEEAKTSLFRKKLENVNREISFIEKHFASEEYKQRVQERDRARQEQERDQQEKKAKVAFEQAFNKEMDEYREKKLVRPTIEDTPERSGEDPAVILIESPARAEFDAFLGPKSEAREEKGEGDKKEEKEKETETEKENENEKETKKENENGKEKEKEVEVLNQESFLNPENDPELS